MQVQRCSILLPKSSLLPGAVAPGPYGGYPQAYPGKKLSGILFVLYSCDSEATKYITLHIVTCIVNDV